MKRPFTGKNALVTGSTHGIGRGIALKLAGMGARVAIHYHQNQAAANETLAAVQALGSDGFVVQADISRPADIRHLFRTIAAEFGTLDIFVSNSRPEIATFFYPPEEITLEQWDQTFDSQVKAFLVSVREAARLMPDNGRILAITHAAGSTQPWVAMGSARAALESLVCYFAVVLAKRAITVNSITPGFMEDDELDGLLSESEEIMRNWQARRWTPMGRPGTPADIGNVVALLCSEDAGWITGNIIHADGGASLLNSEVAPEKL